MRSKNPRQQALPKRATSALLAGCVCLAVAPPSRVLAASGDSGSSASGSSMPAGLSLNPNTGAISGTPTAPGSTTVKITGTSPDGRSATQIIGITVLAAATLQYAPLAGLTVGQSYSGTAPTTNLPAGSTYVVSGGPSWLQVNANSGVLSGTPNAAGAFSATVTGTAPDGRTATTSMSGLVTQAAATLQYAAFPALTVGQGYAGTTPTTTLPAGASYTMTGNPAWLTINPSTGALSGTPTTAGAFTATISGVASNGQSASTTVSGTVQAAVAGSGWSPSLGDATSLVLTNSNQTAQLGSASNNYIEFYGATSHPGSGGGKYYFEVAYNNAVSTQDVTIGVGNGLGFAQGFKQDSLANSGGSCNVNAVWPTDNTKAAISNSGTFRVAVDLTDGWIFFGQSGMWFNGDPTTGQAPTDASACGSLNKTLTYYPNGEFARTTSTSTTLTLHTTASQLTLGLPAGYQSWE